MFKINELLKATGARLISGRRDAPVLGVSIDSRTIRPKEAFIAIKGDNFDGHDFIDQALIKGASCIIHEPRLLKSKTESQRATYLEVKDTIKALGNLARFQRERFSMPIIAVTGSNGKTTAKDMLAWVLSRKFKVLKNEGTKNNHIGLPLTLLGLNNSYDFAVLEVGTNHFGEISYLAKIAKPNIGVITNIGPSHLEHFKDLNGVFKEKYTLIQQLINPRISILNADSDLLKKVLTRKGKDASIGFGIKEKSDFFASKIKVTNGGIEFLANGQRFVLNTLGYFNVYNALVAVSVARILGMEYKDIALALAAFDFPPSRLKFMKLDEINFIDDTYNSNPFSLKQALDALGRFKTAGRKIFIMGDMLELGGRKGSFHCQAGEAAGRVCDIFITVGKLSGLSAKSAKEAGLDIKNIFECQTPGEAREILFNKISPKKHDIILVKGSRAMKMEEIFKK